MKQSLYFLSLSSLIFFSSCKTKSDMRREEEFEKVKQEVTSQRTAKADLEVVLEESKNEMSRFSNVVEEVAQQHRHDTEEMKKEMAALSTRIQALEQRAVQEEIQAKQQASQPIIEKTHSSFDGGKKLYDEGKFEEAAEMFKGLSKGNSAEAKRAQFWAAESYFAGKDYASAALEYAEFRKRFSKDALVPNAMFRQALAFKLMGKGSEAKLFFQDVIDRHPKSPFAVKARAEIKKIK